MTRKLLLSSAFLAILHTGAFGQVRLDRKVQEGASYTAEATVKFEQKLAIAGMDTETRSETRTSTRSTFGKRDVGGMIRAQVKTESLQISMNVMGQDYSFDSSSPDIKGTSQLEILRDVHKALAKQTTTAVYDKENKVYAIENDQSVLSSLPPEIQAIAKGQLDPETLKKAANQELAQLPSEPVSKGDSWQRTEVANFGAGQFMTFQMKYTYEGTVDKAGRTLDKISSKVLSVDFSLQDSPLPLQLKSCDLKASESQGTILFDRELGRVVETNAATRVVGDINFAINDMDLPAKLDLMIETSVAVKG